VSLDSVTIDTVLFEGGTVRAVSPEGQTASIPLPDLMSRLLPPRTGTGEMILPDGVKAVLSDGRTTVWVHQSPPNVYNLRWITPDSPAPYGPGAKYRDVPIALPYLITLAVFGPGCVQPHHLSHVNECFFRNGPLNSLDDEVCFPALLNCSKYRVPDGRPLAWICTQYLRVDGYVHETDPNRCMRGGFKELWHCLTGTGFNYSSEHHEGASWYSESRGIDPRIATIEDWERATQQNPMFVLDVPWLKAGTLRYVTDRIFENARTRPPAVTSSADIARIVFNHGPTQTAGATEPDLSWMETTN
jgi:hypothetical protein